VLTAAPNDGDERRPLLPQRRRAQPRKRRTRQTARATHMDFATVTSSFRAAAVISVRFCGVRRCIVCSCAVRRCAVSRRLQPPQL